VLWWVGSLGPFFKKASSYFLPLYYISFSCWSLSFWMCSTRPSQDQIEFAQLNLSSSSRATFSTTISNLYINFTITIYTTRVTTFFPSLSRSCAIILILYIPSSPSLYYLLHGWRKDKETDHSNISFHLL
jgi:hypothetical protein